MTGLQTLSTLLSRMRISQGLGTSTFEGARDVYTSAGWPKNITFQNYFDMYSRNGIAAAVIDRPVNSTWAGKLQVDEHTDEETEFKVQWTNLITKNKLLSILKRLDRLVSIGSFGVLFLGFSDVQSSQDLLLSAEGGVKKELLYLKPFGEGSITIDTFDNDVLSPRYGLPLIYSLQVENYYGSSTSIKVHYTRVLHVAHDLLESDIVGTPSLQKIYNNLIDIEKICASDGEMFWKGAIPGYQSMVDPDFQIGQSEKDDLKAQLSEFEHHLRRVLITQGIEIKSLAPNITDPTPHIDVNLQIICSEKGIPKRILLGSEQGELASTSDKEKWSDLIKERREEFAEVTILKPLISMLVRCNAFPAPSDGFQFVWENIYNPSEKEKAEVSKLKVEAYTKYIETPEALIHLPIEVFFKKFFNWTQEEIDEVMELVSAMVKDEEIPAEEDTFDFETEEGK